LTGTIADSDERTFSCFSVGSVAGTYDEIYVPRIFIPWARLLLARAALRPGEAVLDIATGPGTVARLAAEQVGRKGRVVGADFSEAMIAIARAKPPSAGAAPIEYLVSPAAPLAITEGGFDVVTCQQGLRFFPDRAAAVREMHHALKPGAGSSPRCGARSLWARRHQDAAGRGASAAGATRHSLTQTKIRLRTAVWSCGCVQRPLRYARDLSESQPMKETTSASSRNPGPQGLD
jgi:SAM-dependent methyltransferase